MKRMAWLFSLGFLLLGTTCAFAQFVVTASSPANGEAGVPVSATVSFTFSAPLDTSARYGDLPYPVSLLSPDPATPLTVEAVSYTPDLKTISFQVVHAPDTDFVWLLVGARSAAGERLARPFALNYTTAATAGRYAISGTIRIAGEDPANTLVGLFDKPLFAEEEMVPLAAAVSEAAGAYAVTLVRDGVYWPMAAKDLDNDGTIDPERGDPLGFYDPDQDGQPDSVVVAGSDVTGIDMELHLLFAPVTARAYLDRAVDLARQYAPDQELRVIIAHADTVGLDGTSAFWFYQFYSPSLQFPTWVFAFPLGVQADTSRAGGLEFPPNMRPIPLDFVDSDVALAVAEASGGEEFRSQHQVIQRSLYGGNMGWAFPQDTTRVCWIVEYKGIGLDNLERSFIAFVDMITGALVVPGMTAVLESEEAVPRTFSLAQNFPNPFNPVTTIRFSAPHQARVKLQVLDLLGQEVATLVEGVVEPGEHAVVFAAKNLAAGVYLCRLEAEGTVQVRKLVLLQ